MWANMLRRISIGAVAFSPREFADCVIEFSIVKKEVKWPAVLPKISALFSGTGTLNV
jgi:hypothetical protein